MPNAPVNENGGTKQRKHTAANASSDRAGKARLAGMRLEKSVAQLDALKKTKCQESKENGHEQTHAPDDFVGVGKTEVTHQQTQTGAKNGWPVFHSSTA